MPSLHQQLIVLFLVVIGNFLGCNEVSTTNAPIPTQIENIRQTLIGDWVEDSVEFKRVYKMAPPPVQNTRLRFQEDGWVYIPGVLLTQENWDRWEIVNDSTLHIIKRQNAGVRTFIIDSLGQDAIKYRFKTPQFERKIRLIRTNK